MARASGAVSLIERGDAVAIYLPDELRRRIDETDRRRCCYCLMAEANSGILSPLEDVGAEKVGIRRVKAKARKRFFRQRMYRRLDGVGKHRLRWRCLLASGTRLLIAAMPNIRPPTSAA